MGLLGFVAGGIGDAGLKAAAVGGSYLERSALQEEANAAQMLREKTLEGLRSSNRMVEHASNAAVDTAEAPKRLQAAVDVNTKPENIAAMAKAESDKLALTRDARIEDSSAVAEAAAKSAAKVRTELAGDKKYLAAAEALNRVEHPEKYASAAASYASATYHGLQSRAAKLQLDAKEEYTKAVATKDPAKIEAASANLKAVQKDTAADRIEQTSLASVFKTLESEGAALETRKAVALEKAALGGEASKGESDRIQKLIDANAAEKAAVMAKYKEVSGIKTDPKAETKPAAAGKTGFDTTSGDVYKDGVKIGTAKTAAEARALIYKPAPKAGLLGGGRDW